MQQNTTKPNFRYDINGLRAIAIIGVLLYHYKLYAFEGGFSGVDVFFVISGYLMSRVVIGQIGRGTFAFGEYFERRLHRIVPALLALVLGVAAVCFFIYLPADYTPVLDNGAVSVLFYSNIHYYINTPSYFAASTDSNMFLHTWSLSVEWQFYMVYPFVLLLLNRLFKKAFTFRIIFIALTLLTFIGAVIMSKYNVSGSFYFLPTRSWEMMAGGLAFFADGKITSLIWKRILAIAGYAIIITCFLALTETMVWPGYYTLLPVLGAFLVIIANHNTFIVVRHPSLQFIGKISYSLYLWHWPVYVIAQYYGLGVKAPMVVCYTVLSFVLAWLSYRFIENRTYTGKIKLLVAMAVLAGGLFALGYYEVNKTIYSKETLKIASYRLESGPFFKQFRKDTCFAEGMKRYKKEPCLCFEAGKKNILLIGDSHLAQFSQSFSQGFKEVNFLQATAPGTLPTITSYYKKKNNFRQVMDYIFYDFIPKNAGKIDGVVISGNWAGQIGVSPDNHLKGIKEAVAYLKTFNIPSVVIGQTERYTVFYPVVASRSYRYGTSNNAFYLDAHTLQIDAFLSKNLKGVYIDVLNKNSFPPLSPTLEPYMRDKDHVTKYGADLIIAKLKADKVWKAFYEEMDIRSGK